MKPLFLTFCLCCFSLTIATDKHFTSTKVFQYSAKNGTPVFTDKKPKNISHKIQTIKASKPTSNIYRPVLHNSVSGIQSKQKRSRKAADAKRKQLRICRGYKRKFEAVSEKMRRGYKASEYQKLENKRVKYRDLLFYNCDSHKLL